MESRGQSARPGRGAAIHLDLDGTLVDSVYQNVLAWRSVLEEAGIRLAVWRIHRRIGMSGGLLASALIRETGRDIAAGEVARLRAAHSEAYLRQIEQVRPLPGAIDLLRHLTECGIPWAIATSGSGRTSAPALAMLGVPSAAVVTHDQVPFAKPDPHLFLAAADLLDVDVEDGIVVGDSIWDILAARRARALGVGLLSGGYGREELERAGAFRVYSDPADLLAHLYELGVRSPGRAVASDETAT